MKQTSGPRKKPSVTGLRKVKFALSAKPGCKVYLAGTFNDWSATRNRMRYNKRNGNYSTTLSLPPGTYQYKFILDDEWLVDPNCESWVNNSFETLNSVLTVS